jgi:hypothetical protein
MLRTLIPSPSPRGRREFLRSGPITFDLAGF